MLWSPILNWIFISGAKLELNQLSEIGRIHIILGELWGNVQQLVNFMLTYATFTYIFILKSIMGLYKKLWKAFKCSGCLDLLIHLCYLCLCLPLTLDSHFCSIKLSIYLPPRYIFIIVFSQNWVITISNCF